MKYKFIEIGSCDFNTQINTLSPSDFGICVDPIEYYLDNIPHQKNLIKANFAISDVSGESSIFYIPDDIIRIYSLPDWLRGCNKINSLHPTAIKELSDRSLSLDLIDTKTVKTITYGELMLQYDCQDIEYLKIDTEGHEPNIINSIYSFYTSSSARGYSLPKLLNIEAFIGRLVSEEKIRDAKEQLYELGYKISHIIDPDIYMVLA